MTFVNAQQNFKKFNYNITWTPRVRSIWLCRNLYTLLFIRKQLIYILNPHMAIFKSDYEMRYLTQYFLVRRLDYLLSNVMLKSYGIVTSNWVKSCSYVTLQTANNYLEEDNGTGVVNVGLTVNLNWYTKYLKPRSLIGVFVSKKIYKIQLIRVLQLLVFNWRALNSYRLFFSGYPIATKDWFLVRFVGNYYFKLLNF
jgi:hypothetical protein